jgi:hypothetical protein
MSYLSVGLASCAAAVFLRFAPFRLALRILFIFGYFPAYQYSVIARSYVFNVLLLGIAASLFARRLSKPLRYCFVLAVLANTNAYGFLAACVLGAELGWTVWRSQGCRRRFLLPGLMFVTAAGVAVVQARRAPDCSFVMEPYSQFSVIREITYSLVVALGTYRLAREAGHSALLLAMCGVPAAFAIIIYAQAHHTGLIYLSWIFVMWVSWSALPRLSDKDRRIVLIIFMFMLSLQFYDGLAAWMLDFRYPYSAAPAAGAELEQQLRAGPHLRLACVGFGAFAVQPYFNHNICDNYYGGRPKPAFYDLKEGDSTPLMPKPEYLRSLMESRQFDLVLVSDLTITSAEAEIAAKSNGYCSARYFNGRMIWKDSFTQNDGLTIFRKCQK